MKKEEILKELEEIVLSAKVIRAEKQVKKENLAMKLNEERKSVSSSHDNLNLLRICLKLKQNKKNKLIKLLKKLKPFKKSGYLTLNIKELKSEIGMMKVNILHHENEVLRLIKEIDILEKELIELSKAVISGEYQIEKINIDNKVLDFQNNLFYRNEPFEIKEDTKLYIKTNEKYKKR